MELNSIKTDTTKEVEGVWVQIVDDFECLIASIDSPKYKRAITLSNKNIRLKGRVDEEEIEKENINTIPGNILLDWKGLTEGGKEVKFSVDKAKKILKEHPRIAARILAEASDLGNYHMAVEEEQRGN